MLIAVSHQRRVAQAGSLRTRARGVTARPARGPAPRKRTVHRVRHIVHAAAEPISCSADKPHYPAYTGANAFTAPVHRGATIG